MVADDLLRRFAIDTARRLRVPMASIFVWRGGRSQAVVAGLFGDHWAPKLEPFVRFVVEHQDAVVCRSMADAPPMPPPAIEALATVNARAWVAVPLLAGRAALCVFDVQARDFEPAALSALRRRGDELSKMIAPHLRLAEGDAV
jgi:hypothetical protein